MTATAAGVKLGSVLNVVVGCLSESCIGCQAVKTYRSSVL